MNILVISTVLPIPGVRQSNDFIFQLYGNYKSLYGNDQVLVITPLKYNLNPISLLRGESIRRKLKNNYQLNLQGIQVEVFPFISAWRFRNLHAVVTRSIYYLNRRRIKKLFLDTSYDVIHSRFIFADGMLANMLSQRYKIPYMISTHNERFYFEHIYSRIVALRILKEASLVSPLSYSNYKYFISHGIENLERSTHGFDTQFIKAQKAKSTGPVRLFTVAELIKLKNIDKVISSIGVLAKKYDITYTIIGSGPEKDSLSRQVESLNLSKCIFFQEHIPHKNIASEMHKYDIFVMPSYFETFGRVYFEVMAMGIPIICAKDSGIFGIFEEGVEGISVDHTKIEDLTSALECLISNSDERLKIGLAGQKLVSNYTWENIARDLQTKYLRIKSEWL